MPDQGPQGIERLIRATGYSWAGIKAAYRHEQAFRQEIYLFIIGAPLAVYFGETGVERALLLGSLFIVLIAELGNSAIEAVVDRFGGERHELSGRAKDIGSAAVLIALINVVCVWMLVLI
jgi:diacylglycerol kinase (ATP)